MLVVGVEAWGELLTGLYGRQVSTRAESDQRFRARCWLRELGAVRVSVAHCPAVEIRDDAAGLRGAGPYRECAALYPRYHLALVLGGELVLDQAGRTARAEPGGMVLFDTARPFRMRLAAADNAVVTAQLPQTLSPAPAHSAAAPGGPLAVLVAEFLAGLARDTTPYRPSDERRLGMVVADLVRTLLGDDHRAAAQETPATPVLLCRIQEYVLDHLGDQRLAPDRIAAAHHISTRYLHRLFERQELTVTAWIKAQRLERCRRDLADPRLRHLPVHAIAAHWGFAQAADFSRAFRAAYGNTPTGFRAGALTDKEQCAPRQRHASDAPADSWDGRGTAVAVLPSPASPVGGLSRPQ
ncbi:helix-turn-helix domain-containing protein [Streptomyces sp. NPDC002156]